MNGISEENIYRRLKVAINAGRFIVSYHAKTSIGDYGISIRQITNTLKSGKLVDIQPPENQNENPKVELYKLCAGEEVTVIASISEHENIEHACIITAWKGRRK